MSVLVSLLVVFLFVLVAQVWAVYPNKYAKSCARCNKWVAIGQGAIRKERGAWITYCATCCPERLAPPSQRPSIPNRLNADGSLTWNYNAEQLPLLRSFPGYKNRKVGEQWQTSVSVADADLRRTVEIAEQVGMEVAPELRERLASHVEDNRLVQTAIARASADGKPLYPFQIEGVAWLSQGQLRLLGDDMGLGKTVQALAALDANRGTIAVVPNPVKFNWRNECRRWRPDLRPVVQDAGEFAYPRKGELVIINPQALPERFGKMEMQQIGTKRKKVPVYAVREADKAQLCGVQIIGDEAHLYKNSTALRSLRFRTLCLLALGLPQVVGREFSQEEGESLASGGLLPENAGRVYMLTGTPLLTRATDLWGVLNSGCMAERVFRHFGNFYKLFNATKSRYGTTWGMPKPEVPELLRRVMLRRMKTEVLKDLPAKTYTTLEVNGLNADLERRMDELWEEYGDYLETADAATDKLPPFEEFSRIRRELAESRIPNMLEYVEDCEEQEVPLVVFSAHRAPIEAMADGCDHRAIITGDTKPAERQRIVDDFQAGRIKTIGLTIAAGGVGITLTRSSTVLFTDLDWTPALNVQAEDRVCRIGQTANGVQIIKMVSTHILDKHVQKLIDKKCALISAAVESRIKVEAGTTASGETEEEYQSRMERLVKEDAEEGERQQQHERATVERKVSAIARRFRDKIGEWISQELTPAHKDAIRKCFNALADLDPDFAFQRNAVGFNKPDSYLARWLAHGMNTDEEYRAQWGLLYKYRRQMGERFPILWPRK